MTNFNTLLDRTMYTLYTYTLPTYWKIIKKIIKYKNMNSQTVTNCFYLKNTITKILS